MRNLGHRFLAIFLCVTIAVSCLTVTGSAFSKEDAAEFIMDILSMSGALEKFAKATEYNAADEVMSNVYQDVTGRAHRYNIVKPINLAASYTQVMKANLNFLVQDWNFTYSNYNGISWTVRTALMNINGEPCWVIVINVPRSEFVVNTGYDTWLLCDGLGNVLFATMDDSAPSSNHWVSKSAIGSHYYLLSYEDLNNLALSESGNLARYGDYFVIMDSTGSHVLVNPDGYPYAAIARGESAAVNQDRPTSSGTVTDSAGNVTNINGDMDYSTNIDMNGGTVTFPDGVVEQLNSVIYDQSTKTYFVDSRDFSTTYNQSFSFFQYHINYTSVTYIGQTEEYNKYYEAYYELPDGRDSADLTKEDLEQLSTTFADVVNYARSTDNVDQRVLYHFDGDTQDASYWSYTTSFDWATGASLTYMDEGVFSGSLYLDETEHDFTISLPGNDAAGDFTLQFRYYQSYTAAPQTDSWIQVGDEKLLSFSGAMYLDKNGAGITTTSIGTWNEICIIRSDNVLYYYINGVFYKSVADNTYHKPTLRFYFGDDQQTYKKLDELRFTKSVVYTAGEDYTVSSVPFDSSLSLILPDGERPMADEVLVLTPSENNLLTENGLSDWIDEAVLSRIQAPVVLKSGQRQPYKSVGVALYSNSAYTTLTANDGSIHMVVAGTAGTDGSSSITEKVRLGNGLYLPIFTYEYDYDDDSYSSEGLNYSLNQPYTLTVVLADGTTSSVCFMITRNNGLLTPVLDKDIGSAIDFFAISLDSSGSSWVYYNYGIQIVPTTFSADIIHMELVAGSEPEVEVSWESAVYPSSQLEDSPVLAVRSNIDVTTYQIGGVRPSYPAKGQVYAMVENGYITSLQIYSGTGWENVDGRIWTGSRWIPASSYNVITLQDMYDIADATPDYEYIYTESGFWDWWQRSWTDFVDKFFGQKGSGSSGAAGSIPADVLPAVPDDESTEEADGWNVLDLFVVMKNGAWSVITGVVTTAFDSFGSFASGIRNIGNFFAVYDRSNPTCITGMCDYGGDDIWA